MAIRIKLEFDSSIHINYPRVLFLVPPQTNFICDLAYAIIQEFKLQKQCPSGIRLKIQDYLMMPSHSIQLIHHDAPVTYHL